MELDYKDNQDVTISFCHTKLTFKPNLRRKEKTSKKRFESKIQKECETSYRRFT